MSNEKEYLQGYDVKSENNDVIENKINNEIIIEQKESNFDAISDEAVIEEKNKEVDLSEYFEK